MKKKNNFNFPVKKIDFINLLIVFSKNIIIFNNYNFIGIIIMFYSIIILLIFVSKNNIQCGCLIYNQNVCCDNNCLSCGNCILNSSDNYGCCTNLIIESEIYCDQIKGPPCILNNKHSDSFTETNIENNTNVNNNTGAPTDTQNKKTDFDMFIKWTKTLPTIQLIGFISGCIFVVSFIFYACFFFGNKKPPIKYEYIKGEINIPE